MSNKKVIVVKEGNVGRFSADGNFSVIVKDGKAIIIPEDLFLNQTRKPKYKHDCDKCMFIDVEHLTNEESKTYKESDVYWCNQGGLPTIIIRNSDTPEDYISGMDSENARLKIIKRANSRLLKELEDLYNQES